MIDMEDNTTRILSSPAHRAVPDGEGPFPAVVVVHDHLGLSPQVKNVTNRLADAGFYALAPDLYAQPASAAAVAPGSQRTNPSTCFDDSQEIAAQDRAATLSDDRAMTILAKALAYFEGRSRARSGGAGLLGFSMGGRLAFLSACRFPGEVRAAVCFYPDGLSSPRPAAVGRGATIDRVKSLSAPLLLFYGLLDSSVRPEERETARRRLSAFGKDFRIDVFPKAGHGFFCEGRDSYRIDAARVAWEETVSFFRRHVGAARPGR
jgi:carboxymethylenebutenolidase